MRFSKILAASLIAPLIAAHGGIPGIPKVFGLAQRDVAELKIRNIFGAHAVRLAHGTELRERQGGADERCGKDFGCAACAEGYCCSSSGYCGQGQDYCQAPDSLFDYGPAADANKLPAGGTTRNIARPKVGNVLYGGGGIYACIKPGQLAMTYDDGPFIYTNELLDLFASYKFKATFFVTGINLYKKSIDDESTPWPAVLRRMDAEGHQLASHTWSHQDLSAITRSQRYEQMVKLEMAMANVVGKFPTYMRPPYSSCSAASGCEKDMADLGYHISYFDLDTDDYNNVTPEKAQIPKDIVKKALDGANSASDEFLAIGHDIHEQTVRNLTVYMLDLMVKKGYKGVTMGECLGDDKANWYRSPTGRVATSSAFTPPACVSTRITTASTSASVSASRTSSAATSIPTGVSLDSSCGPAVGLTCLGFATGECCSPYGHCGSSADYCGDGCQKGFGKCGLSPSSVAAGSSSVSPSQASRSSATPSSMPSGLTSADATCGGTAGYTCIGFAEGECCSQAGWCGATIDHCGTGCNTLFGKCDTGSSSSALIVSSSASKPTSASPSKAASSPPLIASPSAVKSSSPDIVPSPTKVVSATLVVAPSPSKLASSTAPRPTGNPTRDGTCGGRRGQHCLGYRFGECCSSFGLCGSSSMSCGRGCQDGFGKCNEVSSQGSWWGWF